MTTRLVIFCAHDGWYHSPVFTGDKQELERNRPNISCDENWPVIARRFSDAKTVEQFREASDWAQGLYHGAGTVLPVERCRGVGPQADETLYVYEDLGAVGMRIDVECESCNTSQSHRYLPNGKLSSSGAVCFVCGTPLDRTPPSAENWTKALEVYNSAPASLKLAAAPVSIPEELVDKYGGKPVKVVKIISCSTDDTTFEVLFRDWTRLVVSAVDLEPATQA